MEEKSKTDNPIALPSIDEIIAKMNAEQLQQFRTMLKKEQCEREQISQAKKGGCKNGN